jgi:hypothetical protein
VIGVVLGIGRGRSVPAVRVGVGFVLGVRVRCGRVAVLRQRRENFFEVRAGAVGVHPGVNVFGHGALFDPHDRRAVAPAQARDALDAHLLAGALRQLGREYG